MPAFTIAAPPEALDGVQTLADLFAWRIRQSPYGTAYMAHDLMTRQWRSWSWAQMGRRVEGVALALEALQLAPGSRIAILMPNGLDGVSVDLAALTLGHVPVPMHALDNPGSLAYILNDSQASVLVLQSAAQWHDIVNTDVAFPFLRQVVIGDDADPGPGPATPPSTLPVLHFARWIDAASTALPAARRAPARDDLAALVYTSGTTGKPKGVMLTHHNVLENVKAVMRRVATWPEDVFLSFLPLSHTFERTVGYYLPIAAGACVAHARSVALLSEDLRQVRPTVLVSVPRIYERSHLAILAKLDGAPLKALLFHAAVAVGWRRFCRIQQLPLPSALPAWLDALLWPLLDRLVARSVRDAFGGRLRAAVSGGAALARPIARCFIGLGVPVLQGYGMTETAPVVCANALDDNDPETVGRVMSGTEVRIGDNRELQVRGPGVMRGYWQREQDTAAAFTDGWLRTGDQARIDDGRIRILGRIKELIVTSTGEKIAPADLEQAILEDARFEQAYAFGDDRPFIACAVVLQGAAWRNMAAELGLDPNAEASWSGPAVATAVLARVSTLTRDFPRYAQPRAVIVSIAPWTAENGLLTPTLKLKRLNLARHYSAAAERIYQR